MHASEPPGQPPRAPFPDARAVEPLTDPRPLFRIGDFGLDRRLQRVAEVVLRHARHNRYRFEMAGAPSLRACDIAMVDMTTRGGPVIADRLQMMHGMRPTLVRVGRRVGGDRDQDDLAFDRFPNGLLSALNRVIEDRMLEGLGDEPRVIRTGLRLQEPASPAFGRNSASLRAPPMTLPGRPRVLVIDDSPTVRRQLAVALDRMGLDSEGVGTAGEALEIIASRHYDLLIVDVVLPDHDGYRLTRDIRRMPRMQGVPVVILSGRSSPFDLARGALAGCDSYLVKPVSLQSLQDTLTRLLGLGAAGGWRLPS